MSNLKKRMKKTAGYVDVLEGINNVLKQEIMNVISETNRTDDPDEILTKVIEVFNMSNVGRGNSLESYISTLVSIIAEYKLRGKSVFESNYFF